VNLKSLRIAILILLLLPFLSACSSDNLSNLLGQVERLNISRQGYILGKVLTVAQKATALKHTVEAANPWTFKFKDGDLSVVADKVTDRVVIIYERYEDTIIYWVFGPEGKLTREQYKKAKKAGGKLNILATVKLNSSIKIMGDSTRSGEGSVYYIISSEPALSSEPVLKLIKSKWK